LAWNESGMEFYLNVVRGVLADPPL